MTQTILNKTATPLGFWSTASVPTTVEAMGGTATIDPDMQSKQIVEILVAAGAIDAQEAGD